MPPEENIFQEVRSAIQAGDRARAKDLLTRMLRRDQNNTETWLLMSAVVDTQRERVYCLKEVLRIDPDNPDAKSGLAIFGVMPADPKLIVPPELEQHRWQIKIEKPPSPPGAASGKRLALYIGAAVITVGLILFAIFGSQLVRPQQAVSNSTIDYKPIASATSATGSPPPPTATYTPSGPTPPWNLLAEPYTPTPVYVRTPHGLIEAYSIAIRAVDRQEWDKALEYMIQAATSEPDSADLYYQIGELYRGQGSYSRAVEAYNQSIAINPAFAPSYLGRAQIRLASGSKDLASVRKDLESAVTLDPIMGEARLELARLDLRESLFDKALEQLDTAEMILPESPWVYLIRGQVYLAQGEPEKALEQANRANQLDLTLLPVYLLTGEALQATGAEIDSIVPLEIYLRYHAEPDANAHILIARAYSAAGDYALALEAVSAALKIVPGDADVILLRGDLYLENDQAELALADFREAYRLDPDLFAAGIAIGRAQMALESYRDAYLQMNRMEKLAGSDEEKALLYYWRAQALEKINEISAAVSDRQSLIDLPDYSVPQEWRQIALQRIEASYTRTPTPTRTVTPTPSVTSIRTATSTRTPRSNPTEP
jgi:tetratricopeptide (TPR) repeat protein